jgi:hypothetical protein
MTWQATYAHRHARIEIRRPVAPPPAQLYTPLPGLGEPFAEWLAAMRATAHIVMQRDVAPVEGPS